MADLNKQNKLFWLFWKMTIVCLTVTMVVKSPVCWVSAACRLPPQTPFTEKWSHNGRVFSGLDKHPAFSLPWSFASKPMVLKWWSPGIKHFMHPEGHCSYGLGFRALTHPRAYPHNERSVWGEPLGSNGLGESHLFVKWESAFFSLQLKKKAEGRSRVKTNAKPIQVESLVVSVLCVQSSIPFWLQAPQYLPIHSLSLSLVPLGICLAMPVLL